MLNIGIGGWLGDVYARERKAEHDELEATQSAIKVIGKRLSGDEKDIYADAIKAENKLWDAYLGEAVGAANDFSQKQFLDNLATNLPARIYKEERELDAAEFNYAAAVTSANKRTDDVLTQQKAVNVDASEKKPVIFKLVNQSTPLAAAVRQRQLEAVQRARAAQEAADAKRAADVRNGAQSGANNQNQGQGSAAPPPPVTATVTPTGSR